jgi:hypothetical protein
MGYGTSPDGAWHDHLYIGNRWYDTSTNFFPIVTGTDPAYDEQVQWSNANPGNSIRATYIRMSAGPGLIP